MSTIDDARAHPIRRRILDAFAEQPGARLVPAEFAQAIDEPAAQVAYHFRVLAKHEEIEAIDDDPQVGPAERVYRVHP